MSLRAAVVPVLQARGRSDVEPLSATPLFGEPLYVHAARALAALPGARVVVTTSPDLADPVRRELGRAGVPWARVAVTEPGVGATLVQALDELARGRPTADHEVGVVLLHDPRCPLVPPSCLQEVLERAQADPGVVHAAARPVTDTVKSLDAGTVRATIDRDALRSLTSPLALPVHLLQRLAESGALAGCIEPGDVLDLALAAGVPVRWVSAPSLGRRIADTAEVGVLGTFADVRAGR